MTPQTVLSDIMLANFNYQILFCIFFLLGTLIAFIVLKMIHTRSIRHFEQQLKDNDKTYQDNLNDINDEVIQYQSTIDELTHENQRLTDKNNDLDKHLALLTQENRQIEHLKADLEEKKEKIDALITQNTQFQTTNAKLSAQKEEEKMRVKEKMDRIAEYKREIDVLRGQNRDLIEENIDCQKKITGLQTQNEQERKITEEKISLLNATKEELKNQFTILSNTIFDEKSKSFADLNREKLDIILSPFNEELKGFRQKIDAVYVNEAKERASLKTELEALKTLNQKLNAEAINLTRALKGDKKTQGSWGELILERVLEQSGLRKGVEYETQVSFRDKENKLLKPDVIVHLPEGKDVVIDSKVSLVDYERYVSTTEDDTQAIHLNAHVNAIRHHIRTLSEKDYSDLKGLKSLDFILMFIPIEPAFMTAFQHDENLFSDAFTSGIVIVTPTTLLATLRTIKNIWRYENQNENAARIAEKASAIYDKFRGFVEDIEKLGKQLNTVSNTYDTAFNKLSRGRGNLISQAQQFVDLGVQVKKEISKSVLEHADLEYSEYRNRIVRDQEELS